ncbi:MAG: restriction endonuclease subunit S [Kofleriaceae bacterium]
MSTLTTSLKGTGGSAAVPQGVRLDEVAEVLAGYAFSSALYQKEEGARLLRGINVSPNAIDWTDCARWKRSIGDGLERYELAEGDIVVGMDRPWISTGFRSAAVCREDLPALLVQRVARIRSKAGGDQRFLTHLVQTASFERHLRKRNTETTVPHISHKDIATFEFVLPPLADQRRIANILDKADALRRRRKEAIALTAELLYSAFLDMFGDPVTNPRGYPLKPVTDLCASTQYGTAEKANSDARGIPVLRMNNLTYAGDIDISDLKWVELDDTEAGKLDLRDGDVLFNRVNSLELVGKTAAWRGRPGFTFAGYLIRLRPREDLAVGDYIAAAMNMPSIKRRLMAMAKPSINMANISASESRSLVLACATTKRARTLRRVTSEGRASSPRLPNK